ncbi:hypothetical protein GCM10022381_41660 [Leifsonia kafniensis]|uniref:Fimbrial assembly protein n=1 Tax=Leifsonia kafniensis TaxID=475957 RepID=A0ABP7LA52_9MICO
MSRTTKADILIVGGEPRVDLLPPEVREERKARVVRRRLGLSVAGALVLVIAATGGATALSLQAQVALSDEQTRTTQLLQEQNQYVEVRTVQQEVSLVQAAQQVGVSTEINWKTYLEAVQAILPASVVIDTVEVDSASPIALFVQPTAPLQGPRVATVKFTAKSAVLPDVPTWLTALKTLPGYADALPGSVGLDAATGTYTVDITMHVNDAAFAKRFETEGK